MANGIQDQIMYREVDQEEAGIKTSSQDVWTTFTSFGVTFQFCPIPVKMHKETCTSGFVSNIAIKISIVQLPYPYIINSIFHIFLEATSFSMVFTQSWGFQTMTHQNFLPHNRHNARSLLSLGCLQFLSISYFEITHLKFSSLISHLMWIFHIFWKS